MPSVRKTKTNKRGRALAVLVLAAGEGKRMRSRKAKVLHDLAGKPLLTHVLDAAATLHPAKTVVVVGRDADSVSSVVGDRAKCVLQSEQLGSGHAALQARAALAGFSGDVLL